MVEGTNGNQQWMSWLTLQLRSGKGAAGQGDNEADAAGARPNCNGLPGGDVERVQVLQTRGLGTGDSFACAGEAQHAIEDGGEECGSHLV